MLWSVEDPCADLETAWANANLQLDHEERFRYRLIAGEGLPFQAEETARALVDRQHGAASLRNRSTSV